MYEWVGEEVSALLGGFYGKLVINLGHYQAGRFLTVPATWDRPCESHAKPPFNSTPRKPDGPKLELPLAAEVIANYIADSREDKRLSYVLRACEFYRMALENYHERPEMSFTLLASALESLVEMRTFTDAELYDEKLLSDLAAIKEECEDGEKIVARLKGRLFQVRRKVAALVDDFLPDTFFSQREAGLAFGVVQDRTELRKRVLGAYDIRSKLLHTGNRSGIWFIAHDHQNCEIGLGRPVMKDDQLVEMLCGSVNLTGLERVTSTVLRSAINRWLQARSKALLPTPLGDLRNVSTNPTDMSAGTVLSPTALRGAVLLLGSLFWEGELPEQDGKKGKNRKKWRDDRLDLSTVRDITGLPIRYGRRSESRSGQFTMVFAGTLPGTAKIANLSQVFPLEEKQIPKATIERMKVEVEALATAEGIWKPSNRFAWNDWGLVAISINPHSEFHDQIREVWRANFKPTAPFAHSAFGLGIIDEFGVLGVKIPWEDDVLKGIDFCLSTPTKPDDPLPTAQQIADAIKYGDYFERTVKSGIITSDDAEIRRHLAD
jgi:hypothetical protein